MSDDGVMGTDDDVVKRSPGLILARINWIGDQITSVSIFGWYSGSLVVSAII